MPEFPESNVGPEPSARCDLCPRLNDFLVQSRVSEPSWHNAPVASFGESSARLLIVGLAPGLRGANRTGRPFTGDYAGELLYGTLLELGFATGSYAAHPGDGLTMTDAMITNAVRCVPPENKPTPAEVNTCRTFLANRIAAQSNLKAIVALGRIAHDSTVVALGHKRSAFPFAHAARHDIKPGLALFDSYHCSRYNTSTRVLTPEMFRDVFTSVKAFLGAPAA
ncbi:MAG: uracil-DNA glycosylase [Hyphomicrobiaceae bacterium]